MNDVVFGIMSAVHRPETVRQLCTALAPCPVVIHHDFSQQPDFRIELPHVSFVPDAKPTSWDGFAFTDGIARLLAYCLTEPSLRYFQLLSPTCLPVRPIGEFIEHALTSAPRPADVADIDGIDILAEIATLMNFGYRTFAPADSHRLRLLFKLSTWYFGPRAPEIMRAGLSVRTRPQRRGLTSSVIAQLLTHAAACGLLGKHPFNKRYRPYLGSAWFGAGRGAARFLVRRLQDEHEMAYYRKLVFADEIVLSTVFHNSSLNVRPANHWLKGFDGPRPETLELADVRSLASHGKYFARKFADDPNDLARLETLRNLRTRQNLAATG